MHPHGAGKCTAHQWETRCFEVVPSISAQEIELRTGPCREFGPDAVHAGAADRHNAPRWPTDGGTVTDRYRPGMPGLCPALRACCASRTAKGPPRRRSSESIFTMFVVADSRARGWAFSVCCECR